MKNQKQKHKKYFLSVFVILFVSLFFFNSGVVRFLKASLFVDDIIDNHKFQSKNRLISDDLKKYDALSIPCDVVVVGGGTGGVAAAIQAARLNVDTCLIEETDWLGGMLTSAGVSAIDGRTDTPSGVFKEFLADIKNYYKENGHESDTEKCSVSYFCFEPHVGDFILKQMTSELPTLKVFFNAKIDVVYKDKNLITGVRFKINNSVTIIMKSKVVVDATEFGDLMYMADIPYELGPDYTSNEPHADKAEECVQPLTHVAILKKFDTDVLVKKPDNYDKAEFECLIKNVDCPDSKSSFDLPRLLTYGRLPNDKIMINVPSHSYGNDFHATADDLDDSRRKDILEMAKERTQGLIYYLQTEYKLTNYGIYDEFKTDDGYAKIPYVRESRRLKGIYRMDEWDVLPDKNGKSTMFKHSISIGDYPIDLHFCEYGKGDIFYPVSPYQIPYEVTVPKDVDGFLAAEKNISVSHIINGTTRLQPVVMSVGQAVGAAAALSVINDVQPRDIDVEKLQEVLVDAGSQIFYFQDIPTDHYANKQANMLALKGILSYSDHVSKVPNMYISEDEFSRLITGTYKSIGDKLPVDLSKIDISKYFNSETENITRSNMVIFIAKNMLADMHASPDTDTASFKDIKIYSPDYYDILKLANLGIINSKLAYFRPQDYTTRAEFLTVLGRTVDYIDKLSPSEVASTFSR
jgi:hypothetical protein